MISQTSHFSFDFNSCNDCKTSEGKTSSSLLFNFPFHLLSVPRKKGGSEAKDVDRILNDCQMK